jgi:hypothetical protein
MMLQALTARRFSRTMLTARRFASDRSLTIDEMRFMVTNSDLRLQAIPLMMVSGGVRIGARDF